MIKKLKRYWHENEFNFYFLISCLIGISVVIGIAYFFPDNVAGIEKYFSRSITEMTVGELIFWIWWIAVIFSKGK